VSTALAVIAIFDNKLAHPDAFAVLALAPTPEQGRRLSRMDIAAALRPAGRNAVLNPDEMIYRALHVPQLNTRPWARPTEQPRQPPSLSAMIAGAVVER
jgi:hypothetical protein